MFFFKTIAEGIILCALKEFAIEAGYKEEKEFWDQAIFPLSRHRRGSMNRGYLLGSIEELSQELDESMLKLQSMSSSQYAILPTKLYCRMIFHLFSQVYWSIFVYSTKIRAITRRGKEHSR